MTQPKSPAPLITEATHGDFTITEAQGEWLSNRHHALMDRLFDLNQNAARGSDTACTLTGEELTNLAKAWLQYVQSQTDFCICPLCNQTVNSTRK